MIWWKAAILVTAASELGLVVACGGSTKDNGTTAGPCNRLFDVSYNSCTPTKLPAAEVSRVRSRFDQLCANALGLPGVTLVGDKLNACVDSYQSAGCGGLSATPAACQTPGTRGSGAPCISGLQCQSGNCAMTATFSSDGGSSSSPCGACQAAIPNGQPCGSGQGSCVVGSQCDFGSTNSTCVVVVAGDVGATCGSTAAICKNGLYCDVTNHKCVTQGGAGAACAGSSAACTPPLVCLGAAAPTCQDRGQAGASCRTDSECAAQLGCDPMRGQCGAIGWASSGQACGGLVRCLVGTCTGNQTCSLVIGDGQPCVSGDIAKTCDTFASCMGGTCGLAGSAMCN
jgi:hypothetical protein